MEKSKKRSRLAVFGTVRVLALAAVLVAMSIVCGKYLAIRGGDILRFSFENLPVLMAGMMFGPLVGVAVGVAADLIGCVLVGYAINPLVTLGAALIGLLGGLAWWGSRRLPYGARVALAVSVAHLLGSVAVKTVGLAAFYSMPIWQLMLWRLLNYAIVGALEGIILYAVLKNKTIRSMMIKP